MPVHRAFDVMAPIDVHSARCLAIQPGRAASSPPRAGRNFFEPFKCWICWDFAVQTAAIAQNEAQTAHVNTWKIRGI
jgi:hypothetical protein